MKRYNLSINMSDRINFDKLVKDVLEEAKYDGSVSALEYFDLKEVDFVDDIEEATTRILDIAKKIKKEC